MRHIHGFNVKPEGLDDYYSLLFDAADRKNISSHKLSIYDRMQRDEIQIEAEKRYAVEEATEKGRIEVARAMLKENLSLDTICRVTGLTEEQVKSL